MKIKEIDSLYWLIKETYKKKEQKVKIICDWDDTIQAHISFVAWKLNEEGNSFENFYNDFWQNDYKSHEKFKVKYGIDKEGEKRNNYVKLKKDSDFYEKAPFISLAKGLLDSLQEGLIEKLVFLTACDKNFFFDGDLRKEKIFKDSFGHFPQAQLNFLPYVIGSVPPKWEWIKENHPDFDIFIDDFPDTISKTKETFGKGSTEKTYVVPSYGYNCLEGENIYCLLTNVISLKKENFYSAYHKGGKHENQSSCNYCEFISESSQKIIEENKSFIALVSFFQYSDGHILVITKKHRADISKLSREEWNDLLPILKSCINRVANAFYPQGFSIITKKGKVAGQNVFHFHLHIVPEYSDNYNYLRSYTGMNKISSREYEGVRKILQPNQQGVVVENDKSMVNLVNKIHSEGIPHLVVTSKNLIENINKVDYDTWEKMGDLVQKSIKTIEEKLFPDSSPDDKGIRFLISLGRSGSINDVSKLQIHIAQTYDRGSKLSLEGEEDIRVTTEKLKNMDGSHRPNFPQQIVNTDTSSNELKKNIEELARLKKENDELKEKLFQSDKLVEKLVKIQQENEQKFQNQTQVNFPFGKSSS